MSLNLLKRSEKGSALTHAEMDQNWTDIEDGQTALETQVGVSINADGTLKDSKVVYAATLAGSDAYAVTISGTYATVADLAGRILLVKIDVANTGTATLNVNSLGATAIYRPGGVALRSGDLKQGVAELTLYVGGSTYFVLLNPGANSLENYGETTNSSNDYTITVSDLDTSSFEVPAAYYAGYTVKAKINATNTGAARLKIVATDPSIDLGFADIKKNAGTALIGGELLINQVYEFVYDGTNFQIQTSGINPVVIQVVNASTGTAGSGSTTIPADTSIPQNTEGNEVLTCAITPKSAQSTLYVEALVYTSHGSSVMTCAALFRDSGADAIGSAAVTGDAGDMMCIKVAAFVAASAITSTTFKLRVGSATAGTIYWNQNSSSTALYGGLLKSWIKVTEIIP